MTMLTQLLVFAAALCTGTSSFTLHQDGIKRHCGDFQCPRSAFDSGKHQLLIDDNGSQEDCKSCEQCTTTGYSVCMQMRSEHALRAKRQSNSCSCAHYVPDSCIQKPHGRLVNGSLVNHNICYLNSLQTPPKPYATNEAYAILVDVDAFWQEPYWQEFTLSNLTLHYDFKTLAPEHCEGVARTIEDNDEVEHFCHGKIDLKMTNYDALTDEPKEADLFPDEDADYDGFDDRPQIQFDRDVFYKTRIVKLWITVEVVRPRQLQFNSLESPLVDVVTELPSDELDFDIQWEGGDEHTSDFEEDKIKDNNSKHPVEESTNKPHIDLSPLMTKSFTTPKSSESVTPQFVSQEHQSDEDEDADDEDQTPESSTEHEEDVKTSEEPNEEYKKDDGEKEDAAVEMHDDEINDVSTEALDDDKKDEEEDEVKEHEDNDEIEDESDHATTEEPVVEDDKQASNENDEEDKSNEDKEVEETILILDDDVMEESENATTSATNLFEHYLHSPEKHLARMVFFITIGATLFIIILGLIFRKRYCCRKSQESGNVTTKTSNGYKYHVAKTQDMVGNKERELLNQ